jgi:hypothetical protein
MAPPDLRRLPPPRASYHRGCCVQPSYSLIPAASSRRRRCSLPPPALERLSPRCTTTRDAAVVRAPFARGRCGRALPETGQATFGASELRQEPVVDGFSRRGEASRGHHSPCRRPPSCGFLPPWSPPSGSIPRRCGAPPLERRTGGETRNGDWAGNEGIGAAI